MSFLVALLFALSLGAAQKDLSTKEEWDLKAAAEKVTTRGCANLTLVLDNWKYAIMTQVKDLLLNDHSTVLPDYGRIRQLSEALNLLYSEFNLLKERLVELTTKFDGIEHFVDEAQSGRSLWTARGDLNSSESGGRPERRSWVVVRRFKKPFNTRV